MYEDIREQIKIGKDWSSNIMKQGTSNQRRETATETSK